MGKHTSLWGTIRHGLKVWKLYSSVVDTYHDKGGKAMLDKLFGLLGEASTYRGLFAFGTAMGLFTVSTSLEAKITAFGLAAIGLIGMLFRDKK